MLKTTKRLTVVTTIIALLASPFPVAASTSQETQAAAQAGINYLAANQNANGSINGFGGETDWSVVAAEAIGQKAAAFANAGNTNLIDFLKADLLASNAPATTVERRIIAIAAAGENTASFGGVDYNAKLASLHVNNQIGDVTLLNDDIFGIIALDATNNSGLYGMAQGGLDYLLAHQASDGGFSYTTDTCAWCGSDSNDTAAAIVALYAAESMGLVHNDLAAAKARASTYLLSTQNEDGGFGYDAYSPSDGSSTAWSLMALNIVGESVSSNAAAARNWLLQNQNDDGGFSYGAYGYTDSDTYTSAHAIIALQGTTWLLRPAPISNSVPTPQPPGQVSAVNQIISNVSKQILPPGFTGNIGLDTTYSQAAVNPVEAATSTQQKTVAADTKSVTPPAADRQIDGQSTSYTTYGVGLLSLVALAWFVIESLKTRKVSYGV